MDGERATHSSVQTLGLMMVAGGLLFVVAFLLVRGDTEDVAFLGIIAGVALVAALVVWRWDATWARVVGLLGTLFVGASAFWFAFGVFQPFSPLEFIVGLLFLLGILLALIWGVMALVAGIKGRTGQTTGDDRLRKWVPSAIAVLSVVSIVGFFATRQTVSADEAAGATLLDMVDFEFAPEDVATDGRLLIHNSDPFAHDFTLDELDIYSYVGPGSEVIVDLTGAAPGTYDFVCSLHTDPSTGEGMIGQVSITS